MLITHEDDVAAHAKRVIRLVDGRIVEDRRQAPVDGPPPRMLEVTSMSRSRSCGSRCAALAANKLRSGLTTLGILIGVGAVILLVAVGNGSSQSDPEEHRAARHEHADHLAVLRAAVAGGRRVRRRPWRWRRRQQSTGPRTQARS